MEGVLLFYDYVESCAALHDPLQSISVGKKAAKNFPASAA
jgi:hypothetical protein